MGHCEMLLAVAGLDDKQITKRAGQLASADWAGVPPHERVAFAFARKMSLAPWTLGETDFRQLQTHFGTERALDVVWWSARCQYMIRVADSFQLPLERENAFQGMNMGADKKGKGDKKRPKVSPVKKLGEPAKEPAEKKP
jgi:hypothetical protein